MDEQIAEFILGDGFSSSRQKETIGRLHLFFVDDYVL